jgi:putative ABC transport system permease protein
MRPPAPPVFHEFMGGLIARLRVFPQLTVMALRHILRWPVRAAMTMFGTALSVALLILALFSLDSIDFMIDVIYFQSERQDASLNFTSDRPPSVMSAVTRLPGVLAAEPFRYVSVKLRHGPRERRLGITGKPAGTDLSRVLDFDLDPVILPETGLALSDRVARLLDVRRGDIVEVELLEDSHRIVEVPVTTIIQSYIGLMVFMEIDALDRLAGIGPRVSGVHLALDESRLDALYESVKETPSISGVVLQNVSRQRFQETIEQNLTTMITLYVSLSVIIAFGVVYNSARIQLSERARELATLRVLGFTRAEVSQVLLTELGVVVALAQPVGWLIGYAFALALVVGFESDLFRIPLVISSQTFAVSSLIVLGAAAVSALVVRRRIDRFDLVQVLKTRE